MTYPTFENKQKLSRIRLDSLNPSIEMVNILEENRGEVQVNGELSREIQTGAGLKTELGVKVTKISQDLTKSVWPIQKVSIGESPLEIEDESQMGIEYEFHVTPQFSGSVHLYRSLPEGSKIKVSLDNESLFNPDVKPVEVFQIYEGAKTHYWYVKTPTVFTLHEGFWRSDESGQMMHIREATSFDDSGAKIDVIHGIAVDPDSNLTSLVDEKGVLTLGTRGGDGGGGGSGNYVEKYKNAQINHLEMAYQGKFGEAAPFKPVTVYQDVNGWTQCEFTGNAVFKTKDEDSGTVGDKVLELRSGNVVANKKLEALQSLKTVGDFYVENSDGDIQFRVENSDKTVRSLVPFVTQGKLTVDVGSGVALSVNRDAVKFWSSGAIELPNYTNFKDNELVTKAYVDGKVGDGGGGSYSGEGLGVPDGDFFTTETVNQSSPVGLYYNALNDGSSRGNIELNNDEGYNEFQVIIKGWNRPTRDWRIGTGTPGRYSDKTIRTGETWQCRVYVDWNASSNTSFFWTRLDEGSSLFDAVDVSSFDSSISHFPLKKSFTNRDHVSIPVELEEGMTIIVREVLCHKDGKITREPFEYSHEGGILRVHLENVCSGTIIAELIK